MTSVDTNIIVYSPDRDSMMYEPARAYMTELAARSDVVLAEYVLVEV
jgi:predicted nucleic acid-binding protein